MPSPEDHGSALPATEEDDEAAVLKLQLERQTAELNAKELLLARKQERVVELEALLAARDATVSTASAEVARLAGHIESLQDRQRRDEDEFAMVSAALEAKERAMNEQAAVVRAAGDVEVQLRSEVAKHTAMIRRLEQNVADLQPETQDACVSPRSFRESQLIALRDDALAAKTQEVWLLSGQNAQLHVQLDELEAALETLQTAVRSRENDVTRRQRRVDQLTAELEAHRVSASQAEGRERAMEIATTQNATLLNALAARERESEELQRRLEAAERENIDLRAARREGLVQSADAEVAARHQSQLVEDKAAAVAALQAKLARERRTLQQELVDERMKHQLELDRAQSELVMRRTKQYELTLRLQEVEAQLHDANDSREAATEQLGAAQLRMAELERLVGDALTCKAQLERDLAARRLEADRTSTTLNQQLRARESEVAVLQRQLEELKATIGAARSQHTQLQLSLTDGKQALQARDLVAREQKERIQRLVAELTRESQRCAALELEKQLIVDQLGEVRLQLDAVRTDASQAKQAFEGRLQSARDQIQQLQSDLEMNQSGRVKLLVRVGEFWSTAPPECLELRQCGLEDRDIRALLAVLDHAPDAVRRVDLRGNRFTADGMRLAASFLRKLLAKRRTGIGIRQLDLRQNCISLDGVRAVASALEATAAASGGLASPRNNSNNSNGAVRHCVEVSNAGRVECFSGGDSLRKGDSSATSASIPLMPVLVIDMSDNLDADVLMAEARKLQAAHRRPRAKDEDSALRTTERQAGGYLSVGLQETYGVDLVSAAFGPSSSAKSAMRRKTNPVDGPEFDPVTGTSPFTDAFESRSSSRLPIMGSGPQRDTGSPRLSTASSLPKL